MKRGIAKRVTALSMAACMAAVSAVTAFPVTQLCAQGPEQTAQGTMTESYSNERLDNGYTKVSAGYTFATYTGEPILYKMSNVYKSGDASLTNVDGYEGDGDALSIPAKGTVELEIDVPQSAVYYMSFDYIGNSASILPVEAGIMVNDVYPFYEMRQQKLESQWTAKADKVYDSYGNEVVSMPDKVYDWQNKYVQDSTYRYTQPLGIELEQGKNTISITLNEGTLLLGNLFLTAKPQVPEYAGSQAAAGSGFIEIQAEDFLYRNDSAIHATCEFDPDLFPYQAGNRVMNTVDATSFGKGGQEVTYSFNAEQAGNYYIAFHYSQGDKADFPVFMNVKIDGKLPNTAFQNHAFAYEKKYEMYTMVDGDGNKISVPLEAGVHTISMQISMEPIRESLETIEKIMGQVNDLSLEVTKVAGTNKDKYRDFSLEAYIPGIGDTMRGWADELNQVMEDARVYNPKKNKIAAYASVKIAENQLRSLAKKPDELIYRIDELATSTSSVNQHLANLIDSLNGNDFALDSIYLYQEDAAKQLPKNKNIFTKMWLGIVRFFTSFGEQAYSSTNTNPEHLQVSVNRSRQHLEIMQLLINEQFTPQTGIEVDLSLMPDQTKLVLANASGILQM